jgi:hypothetical protein
VRIATADLVPTDANLLPDYSSFAEYRRACDHFCDEVNTRPHRVTRCPPIERLAHERERLHPRCDRPTEEAGCRASRASAGDRSRPKGVENSEEEIFSAFTSPRRSVAAHFVRWPPAVTSLYGAIGRA